MLDTVTLRTDGLPPEMRLLLEDYPRDSWAAHPGFREKTQQWLRAHQGFRQLAEIVREDSQAFLNKDLGADSYATQLSRYGNWLVGNLHGHHGWEDRVYFPELSAADPRFDVGLEILETDHAELDKVLDRFTSSANRAIKLVQLDPAQVRDEAAGVLAAAETIEAFLKRHLTDEEELAVPIILHHRLRG